MLSNPTVDLGKAVCFSGGGEDPLERTLAETLVKQLVLAAGLPGQVLMPVAAEHMLGTDRGELALAPRALPGHRLIRLLRPTCTGVNFVHACLT